MKMSEKRYVLDGDQNPVPCSDIYAWAHAMETRSRKVASTRIGPIEVSTVFLGIDHQFGDGPPMLFETMTFGDDDERQVCLRCSTRAEAIAQHTKVVQYIWQRDIELIEPAIP